MYTPALATAGTTPIVMSGFSSVADAEPLADAELPPFAFAELLHPVAAASNPAAASVAASLRALRLFASAVLHDIPGRPDTMTPPVVRSRHQHSARTHGSHARLTGTSERIALSTNDLVTG
jgi:hypothetical protein